MAFTAFRGMRPLSQFFFAIFVAMVTVFVFMTISIAAAVPFFGLDALLNGMTSAGSSNPESINFLKYFQVIQSVGFFVIPPFIIGWLYHGNAPDYLKLNRTTHPYSFLLAIPALLLVIPFINFIGYINSQMSLPEALSGIENWMRSMEDTAQTLVEKFMDVQGIGGLAFNIFMIAIIPAVGEELMFRGVFQRIFTDMTKSHHWGIWISAIFFSAMHMQFFGFLPRMVLGAMFGYLFVWTGTIWVPILAHFVNNFVGVLGYYLINKGILNKDVESWGTGDGQLPVVIISVVSVAVLLYLIYRTETTKIKMPVNRNDSQASRID